MLVVEIDNILFKGDALKAYNCWPRPSVIISDGPYGVKGYDGDFTSREELPKFYEKHIKKWTEKALPGTTLWFWNTEVGWATVHPILEKYGWKYKSTNIWDKGKSIIAGNVNTGSLSMFPIVTEVAVQYVLPPSFEINGVKVSEKFWLRSEWQRTGLSLNKSNVAAGVKSAATRKYLTKDNLWYSPPVEQFMGMVEFANKYGNPQGKPYYSLDGKTPIDKETWINIHPTFKLPIGYTNVWHVPKVSGSERIKVVNSNKALHANQKPLSLMDLIIKTSSRKGNVIWEPFGGLASASVSAIRLNRNPYVAETNPAFYPAILQRLTYSDSELPLEEISSL